MITINLLQISPTADLINVDLTTVENSIITKAYAWGSQDFKDYNKALDLSSFLSSTSSQEQFTITAQDLGVEKITGLWFFEFESDEEITLPNCENESNISIGTVANLIPYHECLLNKLLSLKIDKCNPVFEGNCEECTGSIYFINTLITVLSDTIKFGFFEEAIKIIEELEDFCEICHTCPDYGNTLLINGLGFSTINNTVSSDFVEIPSDSGETLFTPRFIIQDDIGQPASSFAVSSAEILVDGTTTLTNTLSNSTLELQNPINIQSEIIINFDSAGGGIILNTIGEQSPSNGIIPYSLFNSNNEVVITVGENS